MHLGDLLVVTIFVLQSLKTIVLHVVDLFHEENTPEGVHGLVFD